MAEPLGEPLSDKTILIVDDSLISRMFMRKAVQGTFSHWNVLEASNGHDALSAVEGKQVDIALLDLNMPGGINGLALAKSLKDVYTNIQIALVTANIQSAAGRCTTLPYWVSKGTSLIHLFGLSPCSLHNPKVVQSFDRSV